MRLCFLDRKLDFESGGGSMVFLNSFLDKLCKLGHHSTIITLDSSKNKIPDGPRNYQLIELEISSPLKMMNLREELKKREKDFDIFHIIDPALAPYAALYRKEGGQTPLVCTLNSYFFCTNFARMDGACHKNCGFKERIIHSEKDIVSKIALAFPRVFQDMYLFPNLRYVDQFYPISEPAKKIFAEYGIPESKMTAIYESFIFQGRQGTERDFEKTNKKLLFVGRLIRAKGVHVLIEAFSKCKEKNLSLTICGDGPELKNLKNLVKSRGLSEKIFFMGHVAHKNLGGIYRTHDIFVHPAIFPEPFGRTIVEAMSYGMPTIVSDFGAPPWIVSDAGIIFNRNNSEDLASKIDYLVKNTKNLEELSRKAIERSFVFDMDEIIKKQISNYECILENTTKQARANF